MLPFHLLLEEEFSMALRVSYRDRVQRVNATGDLKIVHNGREEDIGARLIGKTELHPTQG